MLRFFLGISPRTEDDVFILKRFGLVRLLQLAEKGIDAVGNHKAVGGTRRIFKDVANELRGIMHTVAMPIDGAVEIAVYLFVKPLIIHHFQVIGKVFRLTVKARRDGNIQFLGYFQRRAGKDKGNEQMHHVRVLDRRAQDFLLRLSQRHAVLLHVAVEEQEVDFRNAHLSFQQRHVRFGTNDSKSMTLFF